MESRTVLKRFRRRADFVCGDDRLSRCANGKDYPDLEVRPRSNRLALGSSGCSLVQCRFRFAPMSSLASFPVHAVRRANVPRFANVGGVQGTWADGKECGNKARALFKANWSRCWPWWYIAIARSSYVFGETVRRAVSLAVGWDRTGSSQGGVGALGGDETAWRSGFRLRSGDQWQADWGSRPWEVRSAGARDWKAAKSGSGLGNRRTCGGSASARRQQAYRNAVRRRTGQPLHVLDRFHGMRQLGELGARMRASEARELNRQGGKPSLSLTRWRWLRRAGNLTEAPQLELTTLEPNLRTVRMNRLKEDFQPFRNCGSPRQGDHFQLRRCRLAMHTPLAPTPRVAHPSAVREVERQSETDPQKGVRVQVLRIRCNRIGSSRGRSTHTRTRLSVLSRFEIYLWKP